MQKSAKIKCEWLWGDNWIHKGSNILLAVGECSDGQEFLIKLKLQYRIDNKVTFKRFVYEITAERKADYDACVEQQKAWNRYVIPA